MYHDYGPWDGGGWGPSIVGGIMMVLVWAAIIGGVVLVVRSLTRGRDHVPPPPPAPRSQARETLDLRFARGEITEDEYQRMRVVLDGGTPPTTS